MKRIKKDEYALALASFLYEKNFNKHLLERQYIHNFGDLLLEKKRNTYNAMVMNWKLEDNFRRLNSTDASLQYDNMVDVVARSQYIDLYRQIRGLEEQIKTNDKGLMELESIKNKGLMSAFSNITSKASPYCNKSKKAKMIWEDFFLAIAEKDWNKILKLAKVASRLNIYDPGITDDKYISMIESLTEAKALLSGKYPYSFKNLFKDENEIMIKRVMEEDDANYMKESFLKFADIYLATSNESIWTS